eukprot:SAG31_NODE_4602_length_3103_cov_3.619174_1_plen_129_part_10
MYAGSLEHGPTGRAGPRGPSTQGSSLLPIRVVNVLSMPKVSVFTWEIHQTKTQKRRNYEPSPIALAASNATVAMSCEARPLTVGAAMATTLTCTLPPRPLRCRLAVPVLYGGDWGGLAAEQLLFLRVPH